MILADGDYIDKVAFNLIVNFERMIGRRIPPADTARWIDCIALDGGLRPGGNNTQVVIIHGKGKDRLENFNPGSYGGELDGKAFSDSLGEFCISALPVEDIVTREGMFLDTVELLLQSKEVKRMMIVVDESDIYNKVKALLDRAGDDKRITMFAMQPMPGGNFKQEILGYSLMSALGINSDEIK